VTPAFAIGPPPAQTGGSIAAGTYNLTAETFYGSADGGAGTPNTRRETVTVASVTSASLTIDISQLSGTETTRVSGTVTISGSTLTYVFTCPQLGDAGMPGGTEDFTAIGTTLTIARSQPGGTVVDVYMKSS
jgi:hypothetical protein